MKWTSALPVMPEFARRPSEDTDRAPETSGSPPKQEMLDEMYMLFHRANDEVFEDGMDSYFSSNLNRVVKTQGIAAVVAPEKVMNGANVEVAEEALRQVGHMGDLRTHLA